MRKLKINDGGDRQPKGQNCLLNAVKRLDRLENTARKLFAQHGQSVRTINNYDKFKNTIVVLPQDEQ